MVPIFEATNNLAKIREVEESKLSKEGLILNHSEYMFNKFEILSKKYVKNLLGEGFSKSEARSCLDDIFFESFKLLQDSSSLDDISLIIDEFNLNPAILFEYMPGIIELTPFDIDVKDFMRLGFQKNKSDDISVNKAKYLMRNMELWKEYFSNEGIRNVLKGLDSFSGLLFFLRLYSDKILKYYRKDSGILNGIFCSQDSSYQLPVISMNPIKDLPKIYAKDILNRFRIKNILKCKGISSVKHIDNYINSCGSSELNNERIFIGDSKKAVLIYVQDTLVGMMKFEGVPSFLGLNNIMDKYGRLVVATGGIYGTNEDIQELAGKKLFPENTDSSLALPELYLKSLKLFPLRFMGELKERVPKYQYMIADFKKKIS